MSVYRLIEEESTSFGVSLLARVLGVSRAGFYAWKRRPPSARAVDDARISGVIQVAFEETFRCYGAPRMRVELREEHGIRISRKRTQRLMRELGLEGVSRRRKRRTTTRRDPARASLPDLVQRRFDSDGPNQLWVADIKYVQTGQGFLYLAAVQDAWSRRIVGWAMRDDLSTELVLDALGMAVHQHGPTSAGVTAHSDHGSQYASLEYGRIAKLAGIALSMGSVGDPWDNAVAETFFASLETELLRREHFETREHARTRIFWYIECFYNTRRRHSYLGQISPADYETRNTPVEATAA